MNLCQGDRPCALCSAKSSTVNFSGSTKVSTLPRFRPLSAWLSRSTISAYLDISGQHFTQFPLALMQLVALECLKVEGNEFAELPAAITALLRLTELTLGRNINQMDFLQLPVMRPLDVRALGDLSSFPALCKLTFEYCEVRMCESMLGAVRHASLASLAFQFAHPAPEKH